MSKNTKKIDDLSRGDVIKYANPTTGKEEKGIVYTRLGNQSEGLKGFRIIPLRTIGRNVNVQPPKDTEIWTTNKAHLVANFGGDSAKQQAVLYYDLRKISKDSVVFGRNAKHCELVGNISGNDLAGVFQHVQRLDKNGKLKVDGKVKTPDAVVQANIVPKEIVDRDKDRDLQARGKVIRDMTRRQAPDGVPNAEVLTQRFNRMSLGEAVEQGYISVLTQNVVSGLDMPGNQKPPGTLGELFELDTSLISQSRGGVDTARGQEFQETANDVIRNIEQAKQFLRM